MIITHFVHDDENIIATIYEHEKYGRVIVFRTNKVNVEKSLKIMPAYSNSNESEQEKIDLLDLILKVQPI